ncbi:glycosyltransferase family 4 protein [Candidatus Woesearchaeota archaeon]|nr:glycosyltransferase family 4 protein [Candidatus Woesearchaeota archaeon]
MKLLVFSPYFWPHKGGHEKYVEELCTRLLKHWDVTIVTAQLPGTKTEEDYLGLHVIRVPSWNVLGGTYPVPKPGAFKQLRKLERPDMIITNTRFFPLSAVGVRFANKNNIPIFHVEHGTTHPPVRLFLNWVVKFYDHTIGRYVFKNATIVAGVSHAAEDFVTHVYRRGTTALYNSIDTTFFNHKLTSPKRPVITFVGRLVEAKGVQDLIAATQTINADVWIIGAGNYETELKSFAGELIGKTVIFWGEKNHEEIRDLLSKSTLFVNPSYNEGLPTSVLEAGAMGLPVIATEVGGTREIIEDGVTGYLSRPHDITQLRRLIEQSLQMPEKTQTMGKKLQEKIRKNFDWDTTARKADKLLRELVNK